jgi:8-oxo-dGTP diphosphatase
MDTTRELFPLVSVDVALFSVEQERLQVLLVQRAMEPAASEWALPGGVLKQHLDASLMKAARRVLSHKVSVDLPLVEEVGTFSGPDRDPRGWSVAVLFYALLPRDKVNALVRHKVEALEWVDACHPPYRLAFDHAEQLEAAVLKLRSKVAAGKLPLHLMPEKFTLTQLQRTIEAILGRTLDKSSFRRQIRDSADLVELDEYERGAQRPAQLFQASEGFCF